MPYHRSSGIDCLGIGWVVHVISRKLYCHLLKQAQITFFVDLLTRRRFKDCCQSTSAIFEGMGKVFTSTVATIVTVSGNAVFFAFSPLLPEAAASVGISTAVLVVPAQLSAGLARTMCPIAGVIIAVAGSSVLTPFDIIRRTIPVMLMALVVNVAASALFL